MAQKKEKKINKAIADLSMAIKFYKKAGGDEPAAFLAVAKAFEVAMEYAWKDLKRQLEEKGWTDIYAPKDVIRKAGQMGLLDEAEDWLSYIDTRNESVHDYYGMTESEYVALAGKFIKDAGKAFKD